MILALIPYFGGDSAAAVSDPAKRPEYFRRTLESVLPLADRVVVGVCRAEPGLSCASCEVRRLSCEPQWIASTLLRQAQRESSDFDMVYVTEADQVLHYDPDALPVAGGGERHGQYLVPHRLEELGPGRMGAKRGRVVEHDGREWVLPNGAPPRRSGGSRYYVPACNLTSYGGAFLAHRDLLGRAVFRDYMNDPVEHATGFDVAQVGVPLKTCDWRGFFVEHLSGHEYHCRYAAEGPPPLRRPPEYTAKQRVGQRVIGEKR